MTGFLRITAWFKFAESMFLPSLQMLDPLNTKAFRSMSQSALPQASRLTGSLQWHELKSEMSTNALPLNLVCNH